MESRVLLPSQKNVLFNAIRNTGLDPGDFYWEEQPSSHYKDTKVSILVHRTSGYFFLFDNHWRTAEQFIGKFSPGADITVESYASPCFPFSQMLEWIGNVKQQIEEPNLWATISDERSLLEAGSTANSENLPFSKEEQIKVGQALDEIKKYLLMIQQLNLDQQKKVQRQLDYLRDASERLGRKDWLNILISTILSTAVTIGLTPDSTRDWFRFAGQIVRQLLGTVISLPSIH